MPHDAPPTLDDVSATVIAPLAVYIVFGVWGAILAIVDARTHRLPNALVLPAYPVGLALLIVAETTGAQAAGLPTALGAMLTGFAVFFGIAMISPGALGGGDVKLAGALGLMLGWLGWNALGVAAVATFLLAGAYAVVAMLARRAARDTRIAFGPFLVMGSWVGVAVAWPVI